tara:strand:- start:1854 stop:2756 length:903 start_codon:yes stop_codon:yes gene_type:complete
MAKKKREIRGVVTKAGRNLFDITYDCPGKLSTWEEWILLTSDQHWDNPHSNWELQAEHLNEAQERGALVLSCGDLLCLMQGKWDRRQSKADIREIHQVPDYLDSIISTSVDWFAPWAENIFMVATGNHEAAIEKHHETNMIERFCSTMKYKTGHTIHNGGYSGFIRARVRKDGKTAGRVMTTHYSHGAGGGGPVTKGTIQTNRRAVYLPDADLVITGHIHEHWQLELMRMRVGRSQIYHDRQLHVCLPTYKEEMGDGFKGWHVESGRPPKPIGAAWLRLFYQNTKDPIGRGIGFEIIRTR